MTPYNLKATRDSALNVCKTKVKIKHKLDREGFKENETDDGMVLHAILDCKEFQLDWKGILNYISAVTCVILNKKGNPITSLILWI